MDSDFYIADPGNKEAQRSLLYVNAEPVAFPRVALGNLGAVVILTIALLSALESGGSFWVVLDSLLIALNLFAGSMTCLPFFSSRMNIRNAERCLQEGSIFAVPEVIKTAFEAAAEAAEVKDLQAFWG